MIRRALRPLAAAIVATLVAVPAQAQAPAYPTQTIRIVVPSAPGGPLDVAARALAEPMGARLKQSVIVESRVGAGGNVGAAAVSKAAPDGHTLLLVLGSTLTINPSLYRNLEFNLRPISIAVSANQMLVVHPSVPVKTVAELVAWAKKEGPVAYGHAGNGTPSHLVMEYFRLRAGFATTPIPYSGSAPLIVDLLSGQYKVAFGATVGLLPQVQDGKLRAIAISSDVRSQLAPDVPTVAESGYPGFRLENDFYLMAPGQTPDAIVAALEQTVRAVLEAPALKASFAKLDFRVVASTPAFAEKRIAEDKVLWADIVRQAGMKAQ